MSTISGAWSDSPEVTHCSLVPTKTRGVADPAKRQGSTLLKRTVIGKTVHLGLSK